MHMLFESLRGARGKAAVCRDIAFFAIVSCFSGHARASGEFEMRGDVGVEYANYPRFDAQDGFGRRLSNPGQKRENIALKANIDLKYTFGEHLSAGARLFAREDVRDRQRDSERVDELWLQYARGAWDVRAGNQVVSWGSVESFSPVDVVNPRDYVEDLVEPGKIGVPSVRLRKRSERSDLTVYWLPKYQPSRYPGAASYDSFTGGLPIRYPDSRWTRDEYAARYFHYGDGFDIGLSYFDGYERNPTFRFDPAEGDFVGVADRTRRFGVEATRVVGDLLLKGEASLRSSDRNGGERTFVYVLGGEYTRSSVWGHSDATIFVEYMGAAGDASSRETFQNDLFVLLRWTVNDQKNQLLRAGFSLDLDDTSKYIYRIEYSFRPAPSFEAGLKYTFDRDYYPGLKNARNNRGAQSVFLRYNF